MGDPAADPADGLPYCIAYACIGGFCASAASNVVAYFKDRADRHRRLDGSSPKEITGSASSLLYVVNVVLNLMSIAYFLAGVQYGPVSIAMPILTASKLASSMGFQIWAGIGAYTKSTRIGTYVLCVAIVCLIEQGPEEPENPDMFELLKKPLAYGWLIAVLVAMVSSWILSYRFTENSLTGVVVYSTLVATSTALSASIGKSFSLVSGNAYIVSISLYLLLGAVSFFYSAKASFIFNLETFMTVSECIQLTVNALNGLCIWEDWVSIHTKKHTITYLSIYTLIILGAILCTDIDVLGHYVESRKMHMNYILPSTLDQKSERLLEK